MGESILCNANTPPAIILAGGLSRRMQGRDKSFRILARRPMLAHVLERLASQTAHILISANDDTGRFASFGLPVVPDSIPGRLGPLAGILSGMLYAQARWPEASHIVSVPCDVPFLPLDFLARLVETRQRSGVEIVVAASGDRWQPSLALWPVALAPLLADALANGGTRCVGDWIPSRSFAAADFGSCGFTSFLNVNTPEDLALAERYLAAAPQVAAE